jgi:hypothetical protein
MEAGMLSLLQGVDIAYDNSKPFSTFLRKQGLVSILRRTGLNLREAHSVVPHVSAKHPAPSRVLTPVLAFDGSY